MTITILQGDARALPEPESSRLVITGDGETTLALVMAAIAIGIALTLALVLVCMQDRVFDLKTDLDEARQERDGAEELLNAATARERETWGRLAHAEQRLHLATELLGLQNNGFGHVELAYPADALPTDSSDRPADAWVIEMRERWLFDNTSEQ